MPLFARIARRLRREALWVDDVVHDLRLGVRTSTRPFSAPPDPAARNVRYEPTSYAALALIKDRLGLRPGEVFYDIGCGPGRALCYFAREPVAECIGVELMPDLAEAARSNARKLRGRRADIEVHTGDAVQRDYAGGTFFFMYNPFSIEVMVPVLDRINQGRNGRDVRIVYANPVARGAMDRCDWLTPADEFQVPYAGSVMPVAVWRSV